MADRTESEMPHAHADPEPTRISLAPQSLPLTCTRPTRNLLLLLFYYFSTFTLLFLPSRNSPITTSSATPITADPLYPIALMTTRPPPTR